MAVSQSYLNYVLEQLSVAGPVSARRMFGGAGIYLDGLFFALIADDVLHFKVDESNRADYEAAGMGPFQPFGEESYTMGFYEVPIEVLEDRELLLHWAGKSIAVAKAKRSRNATRKKASRPQNRQTPHE